MNDDIPDFYAVETIEQMRAIAGELRLRIVDVLGRQAMTVTQLGALLGEAPAKIHYHVRELERVGLAKLVETREKGGILEKYYRAVAKTINVLPDFFQSAPPDTVTAAANEFLQILTQGYLRTLIAAVTQHRVEGPDALLSALFGGHMWMTVDELNQALEQVKAIFAAYETPRGLPGEREIMVASIAFQELTSAPGTQPAEANLSGEAASGPPQERGPRNKV